MMGVLLSTILAWLIILISGKYPRKIFEFVVGALRWILRVQAYALLLITDQYGLILHHKIMDQPADSAETIPLVAELTR